MIMHSDCLLRYIVFLQRDDGKEGGIEHGGVPGVAVEVTKLQ
jgi:hypothetical protein